jgi:hypothetical protein
MPKPATLTLTEEQEEQEVLAGRFELLASAMPSTLVVSGAELCETLAKMLRRTAGPLGSAFLAPLRQQCAQIEERVVRIRSSKGGAR